MENSSTLKFKIFDIVWDMEAMREDLAQYYENDDKDFLDEKVKEELEELPKEYILYENISLDEFDNDEYIINKLHDHLHQFVPHPIKDFVAKLCLKVKGDN